MLLVTARLESSCRCTDCSCQLPSITRHSLNYDILPSTGKSIVGAHSVEELCSKLKSPRKIILLVKAGSAVDSFIEQLEPHLEKGDIIIDGGNSHFPDSVRRTAELEKKGLLFVGSGVSGGEEGARYGPSLSESEYELILIRRSS